jgi:hypothetical protein
MEAGQCSDQGDASRKQLALSCDAEKSGGLKAAYQR